MADRIKLRRDTAANWTSVNPVLADGEIGFERDTLKLKVGNGSTAWNSLAYVTGAGAFVQTTGDTMTGPLSVPAGASGAQVPQAQEVSKIGGKAGLTLSGTGGVISGIPPGVAQITINFAIVNTTASSLTLEISSVTASAYLGVVCETTGSSGSVAPMGSNISIPRNSGGLTGSVTLSSQLNSTVKYINGILAAPTSPANMVIIAGRVVPVGEIDRVAVYGANISGVLGVNWEFA